MAPALLAFGVAVVKTDQTGLPLVSLPLECDFWAGITEIESITLADASLRTNVSLNLVCVILKLVWATPPTISSRPEQ